MTGENGIDARLEGKLGFDKVRAMVSDRCSTEYAVARVAGETFVSDPVFDLRPERLSVEDFIALTIKLS